MIRENRNWTDYRIIFPGLMEVDFHYGRRDSYKQNYWDCMAQVHEQTLEALRKAQAEGYQHVMFRHGASTSRPGQTTARSIVRGLMRSKESTPYIIKSKSIQHPTVFVAAIRPKAGEK